MLSNQNNSVSVCNRVTMPLTSPGVESEARAITKRNRRLDSGMAALKLDSRTPLGEQGTEHSPDSGSATHDSASGKVCSHPYTAPNNPRDDRTPAFSAFVRASGVIVSYALQDCLQSPASWVAPVLCVRGLTRPCDAHVTSQIVPARYR